MKVAGFDNIYFYMHPLRVNCNVYAFKNPDRSIDLIDTGIIYVRPILAQVLREMNRDGLDFRNVGAIYHTHGHFDHCQADRWFLNHVVNDNVKIYCPRDDVWRLLEGNSKIQHEYFVRHIQHYLPGDFGEMFSKSGFGRISWLFKHVFLKFMSVPRLESNCIIPLDDGDRITLGGHDATVITTGGHSDGHSFFDFRDLELLVIGDHDAVNELTCDYRKIIKASAIIADIQPEVVFIGHNKIRTGRDNISRSCEAWFTQFKRILEIFGRVAIKFQNRLPLSFYLEKVLGYIQKITLLRYWAFQTIFVVIKFVIEEGIGDLEYDEVAQDLILNVHPGAIQEFKASFEENIIKIKES